MSAAHLVVIDMQEVFAEPGGPWSVPRFEAILEPIERLVAAHAPHVTFTRFVAPEEPEGAWIAYYERFPFALVAGFLVTVVASRASVRRQEAEPPEPAAARVAVSA